MVDLVPVDGRVSSPVRTALADICSRFIRHEDPGLAQVSEYNYKFYIVVNITLTNVLS